jgi:hypothetical protein
MFYKQKLHQINMKNATKFILSILLLVLSLQLTLACNSYNDLSADDGIIIITREVPADEYYNYNNHDLENEDRYPIYDYRYGYSYRATAEYQQYHQRIDYNDEYDYNEPDYYNYHSNSYSFQYRPNIYYTYDDYMRKYTAHECYVNPPYNQLIYVRCP